MLLAVIQQLLIRTVHRRIGAVVVDACGPSLGQGDDVLGLLGLFNRQKSDARFGISAFYNFLIRNDHSRLKENGE